jgi:hypothetical protein
MPQTVEQMMDEAAIMKVQMRYCRACDRVDAEALRACFHADATANYGEGEWDLEGYMAHATSQMGKFISTTHNTGNQLVELDGDSAWAEHYTVATHRHPPAADGSTSDMIASVRYVDRMERRGGEWRIARRVMLLDWFRIEPVSGVNHDAARGRRDRTDPSYLR